MKNMDFSRDHGAVYGQSGHTHYEQDGRLFNIDGTPAGVPRAAGVQKEPAKPAMEPPPAEAEKPNTLKPPEEGWPDFSQMNWDRLKKWLAQAALPIETPPNREAALQALRDLGLLA